MSPELIPYGVSVGEVIETTLKQAQIVQYGSTMQITSQNDGGSCSGSNWIIPLTPQLILQNQNHPKWKWKPLRNRSTSSPNELHI